jgi:O-antigen ligase
MRVPGFISLISMASENDGVETASATSVARRTFLFLLPTAITVYFCFNAGGFFPEGVALGAILLAAALVLRIALAESPFEGFSVPLAIAAGALALFALWTLLSGRWSNAPGRALIEFDRVLLYLLALLLFGSLRRTSSDVRWMLRGLAVGITAVCLTGLATRVLPDVFPIADTIVKGRLSYPVTYWNALGLLASVGIILCFHFACSRSEPRAVRVFGAAAIPLLAPTLYFTFSRGAMAAGVVGLLTYVAVGRPRSLLSGLLATVPPTVVAVIVAYHADLLATEKPTTEAAVTQGHDVAIAVFACVAGAALLRVALLALDFRVAELVLREQISPRLRATVAAAVASVAILLFVALDVPAGIGNQYDRFVNNSGSGAAGSDLRTRLTNPANNGRIDTWRVAVDEFTDRQFAGAGAGTYQNAWMTDRPVTLSVRDAHSLYLEVMGELGVVGLVLLASALLTILVTLALRARGMNRTLYAALFAASLTWALHAGLDWDWEMPAVTLWVFALGGAALAASPRRPGRPWQPGLAFRSAALVACFSLAIVPGLVLVSQTRLEKSADAFARGDCAAAVSEADSAVSILAARAEPYEIRGFCRVQHGAPHEAVRDFEQAVDRDPDAWIYHYGLAVARGAARLDPRPEATLALRLNPMSAEVQYAAKLLRTPDRRRWRPAAEKLLRGASPFYLSSR